VGPRAGLDVVSITRTTENSSLMKLNFKCASVMERCGGRMA